MNEEFIEKTKSVCRQCHRVVEANVVSRQGKYFIKQICPEHGDFEAPHVFDEPLLYQEMRRIFCRHPGPVVPHDLILYLTSRCNMKCNICYVGKDALAEDLQIEKIQALLDGYRGKMVHLSGGEPTLREDLFDIIRAVRRRGFHVGIFTNGLRLADKSYVEKLKDAGAELIILQLDSLSDAVCRTLRNAEIVKDKLTALLNIKEAGLGIYLFSAVAAGVNDAHLGELIEFSKENIESVDVLNFNPVWQMGRDAGFPRMAASSLFKIMERSGLALKDFLLCTEMSHLFFEIFRKLANRKWVRQPPCAQRIYLFKCGEKVLKLTELFDSEALLRRLRIANDALDGESLLGRWINFIFRFPLFFLCRQIFLNENLRALLFSIVGDFFSGKNARRRVASRMLSVMIGAFHGFEDADLRFIQKCTLYANNFENRGILSACLRQMCIG